MDLVYITSIQNQLELCRGRMNNHGISQITKLPDQSGRRGRVMKSYDDSLPHPLDPME
jgi:hypothetical protein